MTIQANILKVIEDVKKDPTGEKGERLRKLAINAIYAGQDPTNHAWTDYMTHYAGSPTNPVQLARLTGINDTPCPDSPYIREARAYLIANATCGTPTFTTDMFGIDDVLDKTLPPDDAHNASSDDKSPAQQ